MTIKTPAMTPTIDVCKLSMYDPPFSALNVAQLCASAGYLSMIPYSAIVTAHQIASLGPRHSRVRSHGDLLILKGAAAFKKIIPHGEVAYPEGAP